MPDLWDRVVKVLRTIFPHQFVLRGFLQIRLESILMMYVSVTLRNVAVTSRRNVANQRSYVIIIARKEGGAWECVIINAPQSVDRGEG